MFTYLVHSSALFCAALQSHWPKVCTVDVRKEYVEKKRKSIVNNEMLYPYSSHVAQRVPLST